MSVQGRGSPAVQRELPRFYARHMKRSRTGAVIHWTRLVLLALFAAAIVALGVGALTRHEWLRAAGWLVTLVIVVTPTLVTHWYLARHAKLSDPHPQSV